MDAKTVGGVVQVAVLLGYAAFVAREGYRERKPYWSTGSWVGFTLTVVVGFSLVAFALAFAIAVDNHAGWVGAPRSDRRSLWIVAALASMISGVLLTGGVLTWFARGEPAVPFLFTGKRVGGRASVVPATLPPAEVSSLQPGMSPGASRSSTPTRQARARER